MGRAPGIFLLMIMVALWVPVQLYAQAGEQPVVQARTVQNASAGAIVENTVAANDPDSGFENITIRWVQNNWKWLVLTLIALVSALATIIFGVLHRKDSKRRARERDKADDRRHQEVIGALIRWTAEEYDKSPTDNQEALKNIKTTLQYQQASEIQKSFIHAHNLQMEGKTQEARDKWRSVAQKIEKTSEPQSIKWISLARFNAGYLSAKLEKYEESLKDYNEVIRLNPKDARAYNNRGNTKSDLGHLKEALSDYDRAIQLNPNSSAAYNNRGVANRRLGYVKEALSDYDEALRLDPNLAIVYNNRGNARKHLGFAEEALVDFNKAIDLDSKLAIAYSNRGNTNIFLGRLEEALKDYNRTFGLDLILGLTSQGKRETIRELYQALELAKSFQNNNLVDTITKIIHRVESTLKSPSSLR